MVLEAQLAKLAELGLFLTEGVTINDLLRAFDRQAYEESPFDLVLFMLGTEVEQEPWSGPLCKQVWSFDTECIRGTGDYVNIIKKLCHLSGNSDYLINVVDLIDLETGEAWLEYQRPNGTHQHWDIEIFHDWVDMLTISYVMDHIEHDGKKFYSKENGQSTVLFYLDTFTVQQLNELCSASLYAVLPT
jgi:hypothetical protein